MKWEDLQSSENIEDRRGQSGGGMFGGGPSVGGGGIGLGTIVVLGVIGWALGINPSLLIGGADMLTRMGGGSQASRQDTGPSREAAPPSAASRLLRTPLWLALTALALGLLVLALATHDLRDAAFSTSGQRELVGNRVGSFGAWLSDGLLFLLGFSAWWLPLLALRAWLRSLAGLLRHDLAPVPRWSQRVRWWAGVVLLIGVLLASAVMPLSLPKRW